MRVQDATSVKPADVALVVVHGMGRQQQGETLLEWAEPILGRIDWLTKHARGAHLDSVSADADELGVTIIDSVMNGAATPHVLVNARWRASATMIAERRIAIVEARWSESFVPMTRTDVFNWGAKFLWRSLTRMFLQFARTMVGIPLVTLKGRIGGTVSVGQALLAIPALVAGVALVAASFVVMAALGVLLTLILPLLSPLMLIPLVKKWVQAIVDVLVDFVGDVGTYRQKPLRAAAMRVVLHDALAHAATMIDQPNGELAVLAHSQGAAISAVALFHELDLSNLPVKRLATVGAAITLLGKTMWDTGPQRESYKPIANWVRNAPGIQWDNYWAIWDPFAAGPIGDSFGARYRRWERCYREGATAQREDDSVECRYFPAEHAVHNTSLPFTDHQSYARNSVQVIEPIALELMGPGFVNETASTTGERNRRVVGIRRARGIMLIASIIIAALLPTQAWFSTAIGVGIEGAKGVVLGILRGLQWDPELDIGPVYSSAESRFTLLGVVLLIALVAAGLIWVSGFIAGHAERQVVWETTSGLYTYFLAELLFQAAILAAAAGLIAATAMETWPGTIVPIIAGLAVPLTLLMVHLGGVPISAPASNPPTTTR